MSEDALNPEALGFTEQDKHRAKIIEEVAAMKRLATETGNAHHIPDMNNLEEMALRAVEPADTEKT